MNIVFYDGECGLCQRSIAWLSKADIHKKLFFAPLNGVTFKNIYESPSKLETVLFYSENKTYSKGCALIELGKVLRGKYLLLTLLILIPEFIRDWVYDFIARHRKRITCVLIKRDERFLN